MAIEPDVASVVSELESQLEVIANEAAALQQSAAGDEHTALHALSGIDRSIAVMRRVILDVLDLEAIELGTFRLHSSPSDLRAALVEAMQMVGSPTVSVRAPAILHAPADPPRLKRALATLLRLAVATAAAGTPVIARLDRRIDRAVISLLVIGTSFANRIESVLGHGNAPAPHWDAEQLALYVARHTIAAHGGTLGAECMHELGSRVFLELPLAHR
jgi:K+-sensing histidine kinase KdpD